VLAGGAFNTPQLLMLSGIGDAAAVARHGITPRVNNPAVGRNLQDRYEISVISRMPRPWASLAGAAFSRDDPLYRQWAADHSGMYVSNGGMIAARWPSAGADAVPDLFAMALLARFAGYEPGYAMRLLEGRDCLSWVVLKGYTHNRAGTVSLRSADPRDVPLIEFRYFDESGAGSGDDMAAMIEGVRRVRRLTEGLGAEEILPGREVQSDEAIAAFVRDNAWGHHASCSCPMPEVLDSALRVRGTTGLRVVDASVFPRIPGLFIAAAVYLMAEKAATEMLA
jgi:choline dehydrogenase